MAHSSHIQIAEITWSSHTGAGIAHLSRIQSAGIAWSSHRNWNSSVSSYTGAETAVSSHTQ
jgi:hypothetical protein